MSDRSSFGVDFRRPLFAPCCMKGDAHYLLGQQLHQHVGLREDINSENIRPSLVTSRLENLRTLYSSLPGG